MFRTIANVVVAAMLLLPSALAVAADEFVSPAIQKQLALLEDQIDIGIAALTVAQAAYPALDIQAYSAKLDELALKAALLAKGTRDPETRIRVLNTVLFRQEGFRYDHEGFALGGRKEHYYLNGILDTKKGTCFTMPLLYIAVAQRLGWPVYPVTAPSHFFARYVEPAFDRQNIEVTSGGKYFEDTWYIEDFSISPEALKSGSYMRTLSYREYMGHILYSGAYAFTRDGHKALAYVEKAVSLDPLDPTFHLSLGEGYLLKSKIVTGKFAEELQEDSKKEMTRAKQLGFVSEDAIKTGRSTRGQLK